VGLFPDANWQQRVIRLHQGDRVLVYADGVAEASNLSGEEWGVDGLLQAANGHEIDSADELVRSILDSMDDFSGSVQTDDATLAALRVL
jgi:phosphoserine phosphatase RsbU/P